MSFWGATVITNLLSPIPNLLEWVCGGYFVSTPTLKRFYVLHFVLPFFSLSIITFHIFYLHQQGSNNPLGANHNNFLPFYPLVASKDIYGAIILTFISISLGSFGILPISHPDNALTVNGFQTPNHILPEWYFLPFYAILKAIPNKNAGFIILLSSILLPSLFSSGQANPLAGVAFKGSLNTLIRLRFNLTFGFFFISFFLLSFSANLFLGAQLPNERFLAQGRIFLIYFFLFALSFLEPQRLNL